MKSVVWGEEDPTHLIPLPSIAPITQRSPRTTPTPAPAPTSTSAPAPTPLAPAIVAPAPASTPAPRSRSRPSRHRRVSQRRFRTRSRQTLLPLYGFYAFNSRTPHTPTPASPSLLPALGLNNLLLHHRLHILLILLLVLTLNTDPSTSSPNRLTQPFLPIPSEGSSKNTSRSPHIYRAFLLPVRSAHSPSSYCSDRSLPLPPLSIPPLILLLHLALSSPSRSFRRRRSVHPSS